MPADQRNMVVLPTFLLGCVTVHFRRATYYLVLSACYLLRAVHLRLAFEDQALQVPSDHCRGGIHLHTAADLSAGARIIHSQWGHLAFWHDTQKDA